MDVRFYTKLRDGKVRAFENVDVRTADRMFDQHKKLLGDPFVTYYRVTMSDPSRGGYIVRDSDMEVWGIGGSL